MLAPRSLTNFDELCKALYVLLTLMKIEVQLFTLNLKLGAQILSVGPMMTPSGFLTCFEDKQAHKSYTEKRN